MTEQRSFLPGSSKASLAHKSQVLFVRISFAILFAVLSPLYYLNRWDFKKRKRYNPFYSSRLVRLLNRYPLLYEVAMVVINFPLRHRVYQVLPELSGDVLQVGCGTGLLNKYLRRRRNVHIINLDPNPHALKVGLRLRRFDSYLQGSIDRAVRLPSNSFDVIVFARSFHHIRNHRAAFVNCERLLRPNGRVIIADPVVLEPRDSDTQPDGYMGNSSIDGVIWRFTEKSMIRHIRSALPESLAVASVSEVRQIHVSNYNFFVPQTDIVAIISKAGAHGRTN